jgi:hypothetical protein
MRRYLLFALVLVALVLLAGMTSLSNAQPADPTSQFTTRHPGDVSLLTGPSEAEPLAIALTYLHDHAAGLGLTPADLAGLALSNQYRDTATGTSHIYLIQRHAGIELFNGLISAHVAADGSLISLTSRLIGALAEAVNSTSPAVSPEQAATAAAAALDLAPERPVSLLVAAAGPDKRILLSDGGFSAAPIPGRLVYYPTAAGPRLAWELQIESLDGRHFWLAFVDAVSGQMLDQIDLVIHDDFGPAAGSQVAEIGPAAGFGPDTSPPNSYEVFAMPSEYPDDGPRVIVGNPAHPIASPWGWHDTDGVAGPESTLTQGNNVIAYQDQDADSTPEPGEQPDGGPDLDFTGALVPLDLTQDPLTYVNASITNLFYWNNIIHDVFYVHGFDEVAGNFQVNNYGRGGLGNDDVRAEGQDGSGTNGGNFLTLPDGQRPKMQMFIWTLTNPRRDGDLENSIIIHEYGHGISIRLTGGPNNVSCLNNAEQMGEGWSDYLALVLTAKAGDTAATPRGIGTCFLGQPPDGQGFRPAHYTTDMTVNDFTYGDIMTLPIPHGTGFVWATMLWEMYWELVADHGFNPDFYGDWSTGGNNLAIRLVLDGLKIQPCSPGFVDGRNAILGADLALTGGQNQCDIWQAFARRGLGYSASQGSSNSTTDGTQAFDLPPTCSFLDATPLTQAICAGQSAVYTIDVGDGFDAPVAMSAAGQPAGTGAAFDPNPVTTVPGSTGLTITSTVGAAAGSYTLTVSGDDGTISSTIGLNLNIDTTPAGPALLSPPDGVTGQPLTVTLSWSPAAGAISYTVEVASDAGFGTIVYSDTTGGTTAAAGGLAPETTYYWRVRAANDCGGGPDSAVFSFTTEGGPPDPDRAIYLPLVVLDGPAGTD